MVDISYLELLLCRLADEAQKVLPKEDKPRTTEATGGPRRVRDQEVSEVLHELAVEARKVLPKEHSSDRELENKNSSNFHQLLSRVRLGFSSENMPLMNINTEYLQRGISSNVLGLQQTISFCLSKNLDDMFNLSVAWSR